MNNSMHWRTVDSTVLSRRGFSLVELLVVIAILAAIALMVSRAFHGVSEAADDGLVRAEMQTLAKAIRQFRRDTGYYPKEGPFDLEPPHGGGSVPMASLPAHAGTNDTERKRWFHSPANFSQLLSPVSPLDGSGHVLEGWDANSGRGWRGAYLKGFGEGYVDIRDDINPAVSGPAGDPLAGNDVPDVDGVADPFGHRPVTVTGGDLLDWSVAPRPNRVERDLWGRPYLFFVDAGSPSAIFGCGDGKPCLVSMGPDGEYQQGGGDDIVLAIE